MGQVTSGVGLISGINTADLIDQLISIESRPKQLIENRNTKLTTRQVALQDVSAKLLSLKLSADNLSLATTFNATTAASSNPTVVTASSASSAPPGVYTFTVDRLVSSQQVITRGFADADSEALGAGTLSFEFGNARLDADTSLSRLNGGEGVARGRIRVTDRSGASAIVDLTRALSVNDVLDAINNATGINVTASIDGDGLKLTDNTGLTVSALAVAEVGTTGTAAALGLNQASVGATLTGASINTLGSDSLLADLNDGNGVRIAGVGDDLQISRRDGTSFNVNLSGSKTLGDVITKINTASGGNVTASVNAQGTGLRLLDSSASNGSTFAVAAANGSQSAADLGILGSAAADEISGGRLVAGLNSRLLSNLQGGQGVGLGTIRLTNRSGVATDVDLSGASSVADVLSLINNSGAGVTASVNRAGNGIRLADSSGATASNLIVADVSGTAAADLGLDQSVAAGALDSGNLQFRYLSDATRLTALNGGAGVARGKISVTDSNGVTAEVNLSSTAITTVNDVIEAINAAGIAVNARINDNGDGILLEDTGSGATALKVAEVDSTTAANLGLLGTATVAGEDLNGSFEKTITLSGAETLTDVAKLINDAGLKIKASVINDGSGSSPYRLSLLGSSGGRAGAFVFDDGGLDFEADVLAQAQDAVVFYGSSDPAKAVAITSTTNTLTTLIPGATVNLISESDSPVTVNISRDDAAVTTAIKKFVESFNGVISTINKYDTYNPDTKVAGVLLGDPTLQQIRAPLYRLLNSRSGDVQTQFRSLAEVGLKVSSTSTISFDETKLTAAIAKDRAAVVNLFTFKQTETNSEGKTVTTAAGLGVRISELLSNLTDSSTGLVQGSIDAISDQIELNKKSIERWDGLLAAKKLILQTKFTAMETALAKLQSQGSALSSLSGLAASASSSGSA